MNFKLWLENMISSDQVLKMIMSSPNQPPRNWDKYAEQWGITGNFVQEQIPALKLAKLVENFQMYISKYDENDVVEKMKNKIFNPIIIGNEGFSQFKYVVLDGTHSLVAAARLAHQIGKKGNQITLNVIHPEGMEL